MINFARKLILFLAIVLYFPGFASQAKFVENGPVRLWTESFGHPKNPPLLLIIGAGTQGIFWPTAFCEKLAQEGFFVIRYDHRDTGLSSPIDYPMNPYNLRDLAQDALAVLDHYQINKAHVVGFSMGGCISAILGADHADRIQTIILMATTSDLSSLSGAESCTLPKPSKECMEWIAELVAASARETTQEEKVALQLKGWKMLNGKTIAFDEMFYRNLVVESFERGVQNSNAFTHHFAAQMASVDEVKRALQHVKVPALVIHGSEDPGFSLEHGRSVAEFLPEGKLQIVQGMGHAVNPVFFDELIEIIKRRAL